MHRARNKATFPDYFEATAGGAALCRETSEEAARRELKEEMINYSDFDLFCA